MEEMKDYSGPLKPDLKYEDLSKEALIELLHAYAKLYVLMYGEFTAMIEERHGKQEAWVSQIEAWMRMAPVAMRMVCDAMKIEPGSVESLLKAIQLDPAYPPNFDKQFAGTSKMKLENENRGSHTLERCWSLELFEMMANNGPQFPISFHFRNLCHDIRANRDRASTASDAFCFLASYLADGILKADHPDTDLEWLSNQSPAFLLLFFYYQRCQQLPAVP